MTVTIDLPDDLVEMLISRWLSEGLPLAAGIRWLLLRGMEASADYANEAASILQDYPYSGLSDDECVSFVQNVRDEVWRNRRRP